MVTVLVIDADPAVRLAVKSVLEPAGLTVIGVADAAAALERLAVLRADLVICDIDPSAPDTEPGISAIGTNRPERSSSAAMYSWKIGPTRVVQNVISPTDDWRSTTGTSNTVYGSSQSKGAAASLRVP